MQQEEKDRVIGKETIKKPGMLLLDYWINATSRSIKMWKAWHRIKILPVT
jgi:hypothetical protein